MQKKMIANKDSAKSENEVFCARNPMKLRDILQKGKPVELIEVRTNDPLEDPEDVYEDGLLFGYCKWDGKDLIPLDGDFYSLDEEVVRFKFEDENHLIYWIYSEWV